MEIFLFGAGASYGSDSVDTPPMGGSLFEPLRRFNPLGWGQLPSSLETEFRDDFEHGMSRLADTNSHIMPVLQRSMAAFFFNYQPRISNLYIEIARRIQISNWHGAICTLNYERLLEISLLHTGIQPVVNQAGRGQVELYLPHGCCHIFCEGVRMSASGVSFSGTNITTDGPVTAISNPSEFQSRISNDAVPPVMSYFEPNKRTSAGASFIRGQRQRWRELADSAEVIAIVGVKVRPGDNHIWSPLEQTEARIVYCAGPTAAEEYRKWAAGSRVGKHDLVMDGYFAEQFYQICREVGL